MLRQKRNYQHYTIISTPRSNLEVAKHVLQLPHEAIFGWRLVAIAEVEHAFSELRNHKQLRGFPNKKLRGGGKVSGRQKHDSRRSSTARLWGHGRGDRTISEYLTQNKGGLYPLQRSIVPQTLLCARQSGRGGCTTNTRDTRIPNTKQARIQSTHDK